MRTIILLSLLFWSIGSYSQNLDSLGFNNNPLLNKPEVNLLNTLLKEQRDTFNFEDKKVAFITGSSGSKILSKSDYFHNSVIPWLEKGDSPQIFMVRLTEEEKIKSGGYDVLILSWVKIFTPGRQKKTIALLKEKN